MKTILFVCEGNTCRSPMAACLMKAFAPEIQVLSAGFHAYSNAPASEYAIAEMARRGLSLNAHKSRVLFSTDIEKADLIVAMNEQMAEKICMFFPNDKTVSFSPAILDPIVGSVKDYQFCADAIAQQIPDLYQKLL